MILDLKKLIESLVLILVSVMIYACPNPEVNSEFTPSYEICVDTLMYSGGDIALGGDTIFQKYYCKQVVVSGIHSNNKVSAIQNLKDIGLQRIDSCMCDSVQLWGWDLKDSIGIEEKVAIKRNTVDQNGSGMMADFNTIIEVPVNPTPPVLTDLDYIAEPINIGQYKAKVAIIDSGVDFNHSEINHFPWRNQEELGEVRIGIDDDRNCVIDDTLGYDFANNAIAVVDSNGHGTHIAGIVGKEEKGLDFATEIMDLKIFGEKNKSLFSLLCALQYAIIMDADIVNLSVGFYTEDTTVTLLNMLEKTENAGILVTASAGNDSLNNDVLTRQKIPIYHFPSSGTLFLDTSKNNMIVVAALDSFGGISPGLWEFSNYGKNQVDLAAPGENIVSSYISLPLDDNNDTLTPPKVALSGTSMATGYISHIAAILLSNNPEFGYKELKTCILKKATRNSINRPNLVGTGGMINKAFICL